MAQNDATNNTHNNMNANHNTRNNVTVLNDTKSFDMSQLDPEEEKAITIQVLAEIKRCKAKELSPQEALALVQKLKALAS